MSSMTVSAFGVEERYSLDSYSPRKFCGTILLALLAKDALANKAPFGGAVGSCGDSVCIGSFQAIISLRGQLTGTNVFSIFY